MRPPDWWSRPRRITVLVDNESWVLSFAECLVRQCVGDGEDACLARKHEDIPEGGIVFLIGCIRVMPPKVLARNHRNVVVHPSDLPRGRGFSPLAWQIEAGCSRIPICLFEAAADVDSGPVIYRDTMQFDGHELMEELRLAMGKKTIELCRRFLAEAAPPPGTPQEGESTYYRRRTKEDNRLDPHRTIAEQFDKLRVADNERFPAHFQFRGHRYYLRIDKAPESESTSTAPGSTRETPSSKSG
jgi:methionyl-tRNA formyltransferase